ncbi:hypothetical protein [Streptomyces humicola]|uniref:hypothetical protein n=1 Tax=Streptomyces humicola TaxID=2953240 RepID=UPI003557D1C7
MPPALLDCVPLLDAVDQLAGRYRSLPQSRLRRAAAVGLALARELSAEAQRLEHPDAPVRQMPDDGMFVIAEQIAVSGHDLAAALAAHPDRQGQDVLDRALRRVAETAAEL